MRLRANLVNLRKHGRELVANATHPDAAFQELKRLCLTPIQRQPGEHISHEVARRLRDIDKVIGTHGVEGMLLGRRGEDVSGNCIPSDVAHDIQYCNTGDTYATTIMYYNGKLYIGDWGAIVERIPTPRE